MKLLPTFACSLLLLSAAAYSATPDSPETPAAADRKAAVDKKPPEPKWNVRTDVLMVAMPQEKLLPLLPGLRDPKKIDAAVEQLLTAVQHKEAILTGYPTVLTTDGARGVSEAIVEKRYPTEFEPPRTPQTVAAPVPAPAGAPTPPVAAAEPAPSNDVAIPTAFETRNVGPSLEVEPQVNAKGDIIYLNIIPQRVELLDFDSYAVARTSSGKIVKIEQPRFFTSKVTIGFAIPNGQRALIAVHLLAKPENYLEVFIVQAIATPIK